MAAGKNVLTKGQVVSHFAEKFEISRKTAASVVEEYAALAIAETKKKGRLFSRALANWFLLREDTVQVGIHRQVKKSKFRQRPW